MLCGGVVHDGDGSWAHFCLMGGGGGCWSYSLEFAMDERGEDEILCLKRASLASSSYY